MAKRPDPKEKPSKPPRRGPPKQSPPVDAAPAPRVYGADIAALEEDPRNANAGTERGHAMLERSVSRYGAGRSILVDKHGRTIAGNKTREAFAAAGLRAAIVVETDGTRPVVVKRTDLDLEEGGMARELAYADNRISEVDLAWDRSRLALDAEAGVDLSQFFSERELEQILEQKRAEEFDPSGEWTGMPEFDQADKTAVRRIVVNFKSNADAIEFAKLLGQPITDKTRSMWYPAVPIDRLMNKRYGADGEELDEGEESGGEGDGT